MKTKIVYIVVSNDDDIYLEQVWASAYSLKHHNPEAFALILTDEETKTSIMCSERRKILSVINEIIAINIDGNYSNMEKSRWMKTNLRSLLEGNLLFIDSDTIITGDLSSIDDFDCSVGGTLDLHCHMTDAPPYATGVRKSMQRIYGLELKAETDYFNSGVLFVKDDERAQTFFKRWHENWELSQAKGRPTDQLSLIKTCDEMGNIEDIGGAWNCQILGSIEYLYDAKIIHFFNTQWGQPTFSPFFEKEIYYKIKENRGITAEIASMICNCKQSFASPSVPISHEDVLIWWNSPFIFLRWCYVNHKTIYSCISFISKVLVRFFGIRKRKRHSNSLMNVKQGDKESK